MSAPYELGITVGRFQTFHNGHRDIIRQALRICSRGGVFIGSADESLTFMNPFSYEIRRGFFEKVFGDLVEVFPLSDIGVGNTAAWGEYVLGSAEARFGRLPDLVFSGKEQRRLSWFSGEKGRGIAELCIPKTVEISATAMREFLASGDRASWERYTDPALHGDFEMLRETVLLSYGNRKTSSI